MHQIEQACFYAHLVVNGTIIGRANHCVVI